MTQVVKYTMKVKVIKYFLQIFVIWNNGARKKWGARYTFWYIVLLTLYNGDRRIVHWYTLTFKSRCLFKKFLPVPLWLQVSWVAHILSTDPTSLCSFSCKIMFSACFLCSLYSNTFCIVLQHQPFVPLWPYIYVLYIQIHFGFVLKHHILWLHNNFFGHIFMFSLLEYICICPPTPSLCAPSAA